MSDQTSVKQRLQVFTGVVVLGALIAAYGIFATAKALMFESSFKRQVDGLVFQSVPAECPGGEVRFYIRADAQQLTTPCLPSNALTPGVQGRIWLNDAGDAIVDKGSWTGSALLMLNGFVILAIGFFVIRRERKLVRQ